MVNVDKNPAYPAAVEALKAKGSLPCRARLRQCQYLNNIVEQDQNREEAGLARQRLRLVSERVEDVAGNRNDAHDQ